MDDSGGFRMRLGYEVAYPSYVLYSLNVDTDFQDEVVVAPVVELASDSVMFIIPSVGLGLGVPVRVWPEVDVGLRGQLTLQWPLLGVVTSLDVYPGMDTEAPGMFQATLLGQIAF